MLRQLKRFVVRSAAASTVVSAGMKDVLSKVLGNWELIIGFLLVLIMLAGEKGIWGTLEPLLKKAFLRLRPAGKLSESEGGSR